MLPSASTQPLSPVVSPFARTGLIRLLWQAAQLIGVVAVVALGIAGWRHLGPPMADTGWRYDVFLDDVEKVSALANDGDGSMLFSEELTHGKGRILRRAPDGTLSVVERELSKPDGMTRFLDGIAFSQEENDQPVLWRTAQGTVPLFRGFDVEGLASDGRYLYGIEDRHGDGRLLRYDPMTEMTVVLRSGLDEAEAIAACPDGRLFYAEKTKGQVRELRAEGEDVLALEGLNQPGFMLCNADGLWVTEDATHMARLLLLTADGHLRTVLSHLRSAQTLLEAAPGQYLLAEQGRNRVLRLQRLPSGS